MKTDVIILAQGIQSRLPDLPVPKQWLRLPACANMPLLQRTLVQLWEILGGRDADVTELWEPADDGQRTVDLSSLRVTVACWPTLRSMIGTGPVRVRMSGGAQGLYLPCTIELAEPGNSSLKGADAALADLRVDFAGKPIPPAKRTVILLGDVVYSWKCLETLIDATHRDITVCATSDLSPSGGEMWGISWDATCETIARVGLINALGHHPAFKDYQPGQLRRWFWELGKMQKEGTFMGRIPLSLYPIDDYTDDVDVPADVANLPTVALAAAEDDRKRGITWPIS